MIFRIKEKYTQERSDKMGKLIVIEGACDGIGKTTQYEMLCNHLLNDGEKITKHHFPSYNTYQGMPVEKYLSGEFGSPNDTNPYFINSLYAIDRGITWHTNLKKYFDEGNTILLDRYTTSSIIYQSALIDDIEEKKKFIDYIIDFEYNKLGIKEPDSVIFLTAPFDLVTSLRKERSQNEGIANDIHEKDLEFMKKVYDNALFVSKYLSWDIIECSDNNKMRNKEDIHKDIYKLIKRKK